MTTTTTTSDSSTVSAISIQHLTWNIIKNDSRDIIYKEELWEPLKYWLRGREIKGSNEPFSMR